MEQKYAWFKTLSTVLLVYVVMGIFLVYVFF